MSAGFVNHEQSHQHSLETLNCLYEYDDFMESVKEVVDMGCGSGLDLLWWATRTTRDDPPQPLNIKGLGIDSAFNSVPEGHRHRNLRYNYQNFEDDIAVTGKKFDVVWCHDAFQYVVNPFQTLSRWWHIMNPDGMLVLIFPQNISIEKNKLQFESSNGVYHHWTLVNLIQVLSVSGFDCRGGFFKKRMNDPWIHAVVYRSSHTPMDPRSVSWHDLIDKKLVPESVENSYLRRGLVCQQDLVLPWVDRSFESFADH